MTLLETLKFTTSPFFVFDFNNPKIRARNLHNNLAFKRISARLIELTHFCLTPRSKEEMTKHGFTDKEIVTAISNGIICDSESDEYKSAELWEKHNWTRAAYLTFSQINLKYLEENPSEEAIPNLFEARRKVVQSQLRDTPYPAYVIFCGDFIALKKPNNSKDFSADSIFGRDSIRSFEKENISLEHFSSIIHDATDEIRALNEVRSEDDPLQMFNSYYSWAVIFIAVQGVDSIENGIYHYDPIKHGLTYVNSYHSDRRYLFLYSVPKMDSWSRFLPFSVRPMGQILLDLQTLKSLY